MFEVTLESLKQPGPSYRVVVQNEEKRTSFFGTVWVKMIDEYKIKVREKRTFFLDTDGTIYFDLNRDSSDDDE